MTAVNLPLYTGNVTVKTSGLDHEQVLDLWAAVVPSKWVRATAQLMARHFNEKNGTTQADPFAEMVSMGRWEAERFLAAFYAKVRGGEVCDRCGGTGQYGHYGVCYGCGGRRWL